MSPLAGTDNGSSPHRPIDVGAHFGQFARTYDATRRQLVPPYDDFYGTAIDVMLLRPPSRRVRRVLDLGAGTGSLSALVAAAVPDAELVLVDASPAMLERAPERLGDAWSRCTAVLGELPGAIVDGPFDAVVSALAIHHLHHDDKRALFGAIHDRLVPGGVFVNAEQVAGPTPTLDADYRTVWDRQTRALGATDVDLAQATIRMAADVCAPVDQQCAWLRAAGFVDVDCFFKAWRFAVFGGWRAAG